MIDEDKLPESWEIMKASEVGEVVTGGTPDTSVSEYWDGDIPWLRVSDIGDGLFITTSEDRITEEGLKNGSCSLLDEGSVIIATRATIGDVAIAGTELATNQGFKSIRPNNKVTSKFLAYYIMSSSDYLKSLGKGATFDEVNKTQIENLDIPVPPLDEQERIVEAIEERLERVERLEKSVENVGRLADEYDESLVLSLMSGGTKKQASVPPEDSDVPEEWEVVNIKDVAQVETGGTPKTSVDEYWDGDITWIRVSDMPEGIYISDSEDQITEAGLREGSCSIIPEGGVTLSTRATIGEVAIADEEMATNQGFKSIIPESKLESEYLAYYLDSITEYLESLGKGATYDEINKSQVQNLKIPLPPCEKQKEIVDKIESFDSERLRVAVESVDDLFDEYRESVLSHAFQGKHSSGTAQNNGTTTTAESNQQTNLAKYE